jgi:hypothetical protein
VEKIRPVERPFGDVDAEIERLSRNDEEIHANSERLKKRPSGRPKDAPIPIVEMKRFGFMLLDDIE